MWYKCASAGGADCLYLQDMDLEVVIKWSLNCAKGSASLAAPAAPAALALALAFQGSQMSARPRVGDARKEAGSPEQR